MHCSLEIHLEISQYLMKSSLSLLRIISITQWYQQIRFQLYHKFKLPTMGNINLNQDQWMYGICTKET